LCRTAHETAWLTFSKCNFGAKARGLHGDMFQIALESGEPRAPLRR
jgi:hypothetical protein